MGMSEPREVRPQVWLTWNPEALGIVPVTVADGVLRTGLQLRVRPVIVAGATRATTALAGAVVRLWAVSRQVVTRRASSCNGFGQRT